MVGNRRLGQNGSHMAPELDDLITLACQYAGRNFARVEWVQYFPEETYHATCPQWPFEAEPNPAP